MIQESSQETPEQKRFEHLLPFYLNRSLADEDQAFVESYLSLHPEANASIAFTRHLRNTVRGLPESDPQDQRVKNMVQRWSAVNGLVTDNATDSSNSNKPNAGRRWHFGVFAAFTAMGAAAFGAALVLSVNPTQLGLLHIDGHDGQADLAFVLTSGIAPDHEFLVAHLEKYNAVILSRTEQDGRHHISIDLQSRAKHQHVLIETLLASGHLHAYTLLAKR
jgi:hypothetical protein